MIMDYLSPFHGSWILKILLWYMLASFVKNQGSAPCSNPPTLDNGSHNGSSVTYPNGAALIYICSNGYIRKSDYPITQCEDGVWSDMEIMCQPRSCYKPADLANGRWDDRNGSYLYATRAFAICNTGYVVGGDWTNMLCEVPQSGIPTWNHATDPPTCARVTCPSTSDPAHGNVFAIGNTYEATADYSCDAGYRLKGTEHQTCLSNKSWSGDPAWCEEIVCPSPALLYLGFTDYSGDPDHIVENDFIFFRCDIHTTRYPDSIRSSRCQGNGAWSAPTPTCAAKCEVPTVQNGNTNLAVGAIVENGTSLLLTACVAGYQITGSQQSRCDNGSWTSTLACEAIPCTAPSDGTVHTFESISGSVTGGKYASGSKGTFVCTGGYEPTAGENATYTCSHGVWQPSIPNKGICTPKGCMLPEQTQASTLHVKHESVVTAYCESNRMKRKYFCVFGAWSHAFPDCPDQLIVVNITEPITTTDLYWIGIGILLVGSVLSCLYLLFRWFTMTTIKATIKGVQWTPSKEYVIIIPLQAQRSQQGYSCSVL